MGQEPDQIKKDIERTRRELGTDMDLLTEKVTPSKVVERHVTKARDNVFGAKDKIMGSASDAASSVADTASNAPGGIARKTEGNPLAAGVMAFGVGWLASSLIPVSTSERKATAAVTDKVGDLAGPVTDQLGEIGLQVKDDMAKPVADSVDAMKHSAQDAVTHVGEEARVSS